LWSGIIYWAAPMMIRSIQAPAIGAALRTRASVWAIHRSISSLPSVTKNSQSYHHRSHSHSCRCCSSTTRLLSVSSLASQPSLSSSYLSFTTTACSSLIGPTGPAPLRSFSDAHAASHGDFLDPAEVETRVLMILRNIEKTNLSKLSPQATFEELGFDSLDCVEVVFQLEEEFCVDLHDPVAAELISVPQAVKIFSTFPFAQ